MKRSFSCATGRRRGSRRQRLQQARARPVDPRRPARRRRARPARRRRLRRPLVGGRRAGTTGRHTHPAAWTSTDGTAWTAGAVPPLPTSYYGPHQVIMSVACAGGRVAMIGAVPGGAHGNPRVSTWRLDGGRDGGEPGAVRDVRRGHRRSTSAGIAAGPHGFAIAGNRTTGAAAWFSADARAYRLVEDAPGLAGDAGHDTWPATRSRWPDGRWAIVGGAASARAASTSGPRSGSPPTTAAPGRRDDPPAATGYNEIQRVVRDGDDLVAAGVRGTTFGLWRWHAGAWTAGPAFGGDPAGVRSLALADGKAGAWPAVASVGRRPTVAARPGPPVAVAGRGQHAAAGRQRRRSGRQRSDRSHFVKSPRVRPIRAIVKPVSSDGTQLVHVGRQPIFDVHGRRRRLRAAVPRQHGRGRGGPPGHVRDQHTSWSTRSPSSASTRWPATGSASST